MATCEEIIKSVRLAAKDTANISNHSKTEEQENWTINSSTGTYKVINIERISKTNRRFNKVKFMRVAQDGTESICNLGDYKKSDLYTLVYNLRDGKVFNKIKANPNLVKTIIEAIKHEPLNWERTDSKIIGHIGDDTYEIVRELKTYDKSQKYRAVMKVNGVETLKGCQLMKLWR